MAFSPPVFTELYRLWRSSRFPPVGLPTHDNMPCQLYAPPARFVAAAMQQDGGRPPLFLRTTKGVIFHDTTDLSVDFATFYPDLIECPIGSGAFYWAWSQRPVAQGFPNEYTELFVIPASPASPN
jgi:hypothetical protein